MQQHHVQPHRSQQQALTLPHLCTLIQAYTLAASAPVEILAPSALSEPFRVRPLGKSADYERVCSLDDLPATVRTVVDETVDRAHVQALFLEEVVARVLCQIAPSCPLEVPPTRSEATA